MFAGILSIPLLWKHHLYDLHLWKYSSAEGNAISSEYIETYGNYLILSHPCRN